MNYPIWQLEYAGGGLLIAIIAVIHVYIAHFAVGGGLFLVLTEIKGVRENNSGMIEYVRSHTKFFLLLTMVAGSLTGVGIWFTISLLNPAATSVLIHTFVFAWGTEWVFFTIEIVSLFIYYHTFNNMAVRNHLIIGWIYFGAAWLSLFVINGIIDFMLTPGAWPETGNFWHGFFNPTFWPALFFRTFFAIMIAGLFGLVTSTLIKDIALRVKMVRYCASWLLAPFLLFLGSAWWYMRALPERVAEVALQQSPELFAYMDYFAIFAVLLVLSGLIMTIRMPARASRTMALLMLFVGFLSMGAFEFIREGGRRPYIIYDHMYSTSIFKKDMPKTVASGVLAKARWVRDREISDENLAAAGRQVFELLCQSCHSRGGPLNDIGPLIARNELRDLKRVFKGMGNNRPYMPPFAGNEKEKEALVYYLTGERLR